MALKAILIPFEGFLRKPFEAKKIRMRKQVNPNEITKKYKKFKNIHDCSRNKKHVVEFFENQFLGFLN